MIASQDRGTYTDVRREIERRWMISRAAIVAASAVVLVLEFVAPPVYVLLSLGFVMTVGLVLLYPVVGLCFLAISVPWIGGIQVPISGFPLSAPDALVATLGVAWLVSVRERALSTAIHTVWVPFLLFFLIAITVSATQAADIHAALREIVKWSEVVFVYLAATRFVRTERHLLVVCVAIVAAGLSQAFLGYAQFVFQLGPDAFRHGSFLRAYGSFDQPNPYAGFLNMTAPLALGMGFLMPGKRWRSSCTVAFVLVLGAVSVSESRGALLAGLLAIGIVVAALSSRVVFLAWAGALAGLGAALLASLNAISVAPFLRLLTAVGLAGVSFGDVNDTNFSAVERAAHWVAGVRIFATHPILGVGIGNYSVAYPAYHPRGWYAALDHAHNYYINIAAEAGVIGLLAYILLIGTALWYSYAAKRLVRCGLHRAVVLGVLGALIATSIHNLFDVLYVHGMAAFLGLLVALVPATVRLGSHRQENAVPGNHAVTV